VSGAGAAAPSTVSPFTATGSLAAGSLVRSPTATLLLYLEFMFGSYNGEFLKFAVQSYPFNPTQTFLDLMTADLGSE
jgi:hypothetical protein